MKSLGIDIGGSKIRAVLWNGKKVLVTRQVKTPKYLKRFKEEMKKLITWVSDTQVGIGVAGIINGTKIVSSPNIKYLQNFDFASLGSSTAKLKVDNDARCFARAECVDKKSCLAITLGTGIGRGLAKNGKVLKIKKFEYPENWERDYQKIQNDDERLSKFLAKKLINTAKPYKPDIIILGGGVMEHKGFLERMRKEFKTLGAKFEVRRSKHGKNSVAIGAVTS